MTASPHHPHRVTTAVAGVRAELAGVADASLWSMPAPVVAETLAEVAAAKAQLAELEARLLVRAEESGVAGQRGATSTPTWYAATTRTVRPAAFRAWRLAKGLEAHDLTRAAMSAGRVHVDQAAVILTALGELPADLDPQTARAAEERLLEHATQFDAKALKILGRRVLEVLDPDAADAHEAKLLEREERDAHAATSLVIWEDGHGKVHGRFALDTLTGAMLTKHLHALAAPKHRAADGPLGERKPTPERLGRAFAELVQRYPVDRLPEAGGLAATVVVTMTLESLLGGLKAAQIDTGQTISASLARRLACQAGVIPAVLGGHSEVLDLGRTRRFHSKAQRLLATIEQRGCSADGCDWPPGMCHLHHPTPWSRGGATDRDAVMLCPAHHARTHDPTFTTTRLPTGKYGFHRRT